MVILDSRKTRLWDGYNKTINLSNKKNKNLMRINGLGPKGEGFSPPYSCESI